MKEAFWPILISISDTLRMFQGGRKLHSQTTSIQETGFLIKGWVQALHLYWENCCSSGTNDTFFQFLPGKHTPCRRSSRCQAGRSLLGDVLLKRVNVCTPLPVLEERSGNQQCKVPSPKQSPISGPIREERRAEQGAMLGSGGGGEGRVEAATGKGEADLKFLMGKEGLWGTWHTTTPAPSGVEGVEQPLLPTSSPVWERWREQESGGSYRLNTFTVPFLEQILARKFLKNYHCYKWMCIHS